MLPTDACKGSRSCSSGGMQLRSHVAKGGEGESAKE